MWPPVEGEADLVPVLLQQGPAHLQHLARGRGQRHRGAWSSHTSYYSWESYTNVCLPPIYCYDVINGHRITDSLNF